MECYKLAEEKSEDLEPRDVTIQETEGERFIARLEISHNFSELLKMIKVNIGT